MFMRKQSPRILISWVAIASPVLIAACVGCSLTRYEMEVYLPDPLAAGNSITRHGVTGFKVRAEGFSLVINIRPTKAGDSGYVLYSLNPKDEPGLKNYSVSYQIESPASHSLKEIPGKSRLKRFEITPGIEGFEEITLIINASYTNISGEYVEFSRSIPLKRQVVTVRTSLA